MDYVMESERETSRLAAQEQADMSNALLGLAGLSNGMKVLDVGCGPGLIAREIAKKVGPRGRVLGIDLSHERIEVARRQSADLPQAEFKQGSVFSLPVEDGSFDLVWSQFLFQYLPNPFAALKELKRVCKPGGKVIVSDSDGIGIFNWPINPELNTAIHRFMGALQQTGFDPHVGRKLYSLFKELGFGEIRVHLRPLPLIVGAASSAEMEDWRIRFDALAPVGVKAFGSVETYRGFCAEYMALLSDDRALKYSPLLVTEGMK